MNSFGRLFRMQIYGESHGDGLGIILDGCPAGVPISSEDFIKDIERRKPGAVGTTTRQESDEPVFLSGVFNGFSTGSPLNIFFKNNNTISKDYEQFRKIPRPGHADFVASKKYKGFEDYRGGGHFSGRLTLALVAAGVVAKKILDPEIDFQTVVKSMADLSEAEPDTVGGIVECVVKNVPIGYGEPFFDSMESVISHLIFSIPAVKGVEFGSGFKAAKMRGSEHNDAIADNTGKTETNHAGGINGGLSNGNPLVCRVAFKPAASTPKPQTSLNVETGQKEDFKIAGRHDLAIVKRAPVVVEAVVAIALADFKLLSDSYK